MRNGRIVDTDGTQLWYLNDQLHRIDGPAIIRLDGTQAWYVNGRCHRTDGPAYINANGTQAWYVYGQRHRVDGPAIIGTYASRWWVRDVNITKEVTAGIEENNIVLPFDQETATLFQLTWG